MADLKQWVEDIETVLAQPFEPTETLKSLRQHATEIQTEINRLNNGQPQQALNESTFGLDSVEE